MSSPRRSYHHGNLRAALEAAVLDIVVENGVDAVTMAGAARRAGVSPGAPYHHFDSLNDLVSSTATASYQRFQATLQGQLDAEAPSGGEQIILTLIRAFFVFALAEPAAFVLIFDSRSPAGTRALHPYLQDVFARLLGWVSDAVRRPEEDCRDLALSIAGLILGQARMHIGGFSPVSTLGEAPQLAETGTRLLLMGYRASRLVDNGVQSGSASEAKPDPGVTDTVHVADVLTAGSGWFGSA